VRSVVQALLVVLMLAIPLLVIFSLPRVFDLVGSVSASTTVSRSTPVPTVASVANFRLDDPTPVSLGTSSASSTSTSLSRIAPVDSAPPPTLAPPAVTATPVATPGPTPTGERVVIGNTGGLGAVLRSDPVTGRQVAALHDQQVLDVLEHRNVPGSGDWIRVRTADGVDGWVTGVVAEPVNSPH
jgi:hypothetical protein